jgi:hypothetical protein
MCCHLAMMIMNNEICSMQLALVEHETYMEDLYAQKEYANSDAREIAIAEVEYEYDRYSAAYQIECHHDHPRQ